MEIPALLLVVEDDRDMRSLLHDECGMKGTSSWRPTMGMRLSWPCLKRYRI